MALISVSVITSLNSFSNEARDKLQVANACLEGGNTCSSAVNQDTYVNDDAALVALPQNTGPTGNTQPEGFDVAPQKFPTTPSGTESLF